MPKKLHLFPMNICLLSQHNTTHTDHIRNTTNTKISSISSASKFYFFFLQLFLSIIKLTFIFLTLLTYFVQINNYKLHCKLYYINTFLSYFRWLSSAISYNQHSCNSIYSYFIPYIVLIHTPLSKKIFLRCPQLIYHHSYPLILMNSDYS